MKKKLVINEPIDNIPELEDLPDGEVLLIGPEMAESDMGSFFQESGRDVVVNEWEVPIGEDGSMAVDFALVIAGVAVGLRKPQELERLFFELALSLTENGVLISFFPSEAEVEQKEIPFYTNRNIEQIVSRLLTVERIATMMDGTRRVVARKHE